MPRYLLTATAYINERLHHAGETVETDLPPGPHMEPARDDKGREDKDARRAKDEAGEKPAVMPGDPKFIGDLIAHNIGGGGETNGRIDTPSAHAGVAPAPSAPVAAVSAPTPPAG